MRCKRPKAAGFTLVEIMIVVAILGLLMAVAIPNFARARTQTQKNICISHLREIDSIKQQWALEKHKSSADDPPRPKDLAPYFRGERWPQCPAGGEYDPKGVGEPPTCSLGETLGHVLDE